MMKKMINKLVGVAVICAVTPAVYAKGFGVDNPYLGIEVIQTNQNYKNGFGQNIYTKNVQDYSVFGGLKFWRCLGLEVGYEFQPNRNKTATIGAGGTAMGGSTTAVPLTYQTSIQMHHPYIGLFAECDTCMYTLGKVKLQGLVGVSATHVKAQDAITAISGVPVTQSVYNASLNTYSKTQGLFMAKLMATFMMTDHVGLRVSGLYRNTSSLTVNAQQGGTPAIKFKDTWGVGLGLTYNFCR